MVTKVVTALFAVFASRKINRKKGFFLCFSLLQEGPLEHCKYYIAAKTLAENRERNSGITWRRAKYCAHIKRCIESCRYVYSK
jgi:hypothetical protein